jgi:hypothetical protein
MKMAFLVFGSASVFSSSVAAAPLPADLARAAAAYDKAQIESSRPLLEKMLAPDYRLVNSGGEVESRKQFIDESTTGDFKLDPYVVERPIETVWRDGAVLAGYVHLTGIAAGKRFDARLRFADVWAKRNGRWQVVFTEVTKAPVGT